MIRQIKHWIERLHVQRGYIWRALIVIWFSANWSWVFFTNSIELSGSYTQGKIIAFIVFGINVGLSSLITISALRFISLILQKRSDFVLVALGLLLFAAIDHIIAWATAFIWIGPNGNIDNVLPLGSPGLPLAQTPLRFISRIFGLYGLAAFAWVGIFCVYSRRYRALAGTVIFGAFLSLGGHLAYREIQGSKITATIISETLQDRIPSVPSSNQEIVLYPEYGLDGVHNDNLHERLQTSRDGRPTGFIGSQKIVDSKISGHYNRLSAGDNKQGFIEYQDKDRLIPGGEDLPYTLRAVFASLGKQDTLTYFDYSRGVIPGQAPATPILLNNDLLVGAGVCSSIIAPQDYVSLTKQGAVVLTNSASLGTFGGSSVFAWQQQNLARIMAVTNARYFLQSANGFDAYVLDKNGNEYARTANISAINVSAITNSTLTVATRYSSFFTTFNIATLLVLVLWRVYCSKIKTPRRAS